MEGKNAKDMFYTFCRIYHENSGTCVFLFLILDDKIPKFTCVKFEKKLTSSQGAVDLNMYKTGHFKTI